MTGEHPGGCRWGRAVLLVAAVMAGSALGARAAPPPDVVKGGCVDAGCHDNLKKFKVLHAPVERDECTSCHEQAEAPKHKFKLSAEGAELCTECHDAFTGKHVHQPVAGGQCTECHNPHGSGTAKLLTKPKPGEICAECHEETTSKHRFLHGPVAAGACTACHDPHVSERSGLLTADGMALCLKCHKELEGKIKGKAFTHPPVTEGCTGCHNAHGGESQLLLRSSSPDLCADCHEEVTDVVKEAKVKHAPMTAPGSCDKCHDPHGGDIAHGLRRASGELCLSCHNKVLEAQGGKLADIAAALRDASATHGPIQQGDCSACHRPHGGDLFRLLKEAYPAEFYLPYQEKQYALCWDCHDAEAMAQPKTKKATNFRDGERNLHHLHVNRDPKGRTCRACHDAHAGKYAHHVSESAPFGQWRIPVNYQATPTGGSCAPGCHRPYKYDREVPATQPAGTPPTTQPVAPAAPAPASPARPI